jgi:aminopeptidase N
MENKSLNIFNSRRVLATPDTATDVDFGGIQGAGLLPLGCFGVLGR